jgi:hypothetical protein
MQIDRLSLFQLDGPGFGDSPISKTTHLNAHTIADVRIEMSSGMGPQMCSVMGSVSALARYRQSSTRWVAYSEVLRSVMEYPNA